MSDKSPTPAKNDSTEADRGQAIQINENTIDDPETPEVHSSSGKDDLHSRRDVPKTDQAIQINDNTIADHD